MASANAGFDANRLGVVANRLVVLSVEPVHARAIGEGVRRARLELQRAREVVDRLVEILLRPVHRPAIGERLRECRVDADSLAEIVQRAVVIEQRHVRHAALGVRDGEVAPPRAAGLDNGRTDADGHLRIGVAAARLCSGAGGGQRRYKQYNYERDYRIAHRV